MGVETGVWRIEQGVPRRLPSAVMPSERDLEDLLAQDPALLGEALLVIGRQVHTPHGKFIDLLALDAEGTVHVLELKKDRTPRDVVAQVLDYGSWVSTLSRDDAINALIAPESTWLVGRGRRPAFKRRCLDDAARSRSPAV